jgi:hypothetical protein
VSRPLGRGWATVDLDRAAVELADLLLPGAVFVPTERSLVLGARCLRGRAAQEADWLVLLEPDTEGRLARFLARNGEAWAAIWLADDDPDMVAAPTRATPGPLGPERLVVDGADDSSDAYDATVTDAVDRPFRFVVTAATIER